MSNYTKSTNFATKDNLSPGDPLKIVRGTEIDTEFNNISTAISTKTDNSAAAITGGSITGITDLAIADGGTGASTATAAINNLLPAQTSAANKYLQSDGTNVSWDAVTLSTSDITGTLPVANGGTGITSFGTGIATFLGTPSSANLISAVTDETGSGALVFANTPTLVAPILGTPTSGNFSSGSFTWPTFNQNTTGTAAGLSATLAIASGGTGQTTANAAFNALAPSQTSASGKYLKSDGTNTSWDALDISTADITGTLPVANGGTGITSFGTGIATFLGTPSSANLRSALTDETGTGSAVFATSPTLVTPILGTPQSGNFSTGTFTWPTFNQNTTGTAAGLSATLATTSGGTGLTSFTSGGVVYASSTSALATGSALQFDGTNFSVTQAAWQFYAGASFAKIQNTTGTSATLYLQDSTDSAGLRNAGSSLLFLNSGTEAMRLTSTSLYTASGINVAIGASSAGSKLDVVRSSTATGAFDEPVMRAINSGAATLNQRVDIAMRWQDGTYNGIGGISMVRESATARSGSLVFLPIDSGGNGLAAMSLTSAGNLGLGTSSPTSANGSDRFLVIAGSASANVTSLVLDPHTGNAHEFQSYNGTLKIFNATTQQMTLDASGNLLVGKTSTGANTAGIQLEPEGTVVLTRDSAVTLVCNRKTNDGTIVSIRRDNTEVGSISATTTLTSYNVTSDYRLKNTIAPMTGALAKVALLKPCTYKWNVNGSDGEGFIAHELAEVVPHAVTGAKDAVDADGKPQYQGIDTSFLVATLTSALQELNAKFEAYVASHP